MWIIGILYSFLIFNELKVIGLWSFSYPLFIWSCIYLFVCLVDLGTLRFRTVELHWVKYVLRSKAQIKKNLLTPSPMLFPPPTLRACSTAEKHTTPSKRKVNKYYSNYTYKYVPYSIFPFSFPFHYFQLPSFLLWTSPIVFQFIFLFPNLPALTPTALTPQNSKRNCFKHRLYDVTTSPWKSNVFPRQ